MSKKSEVLISLVEASRLVDRLGTERSAARVEQVAWCWRASSLGKATDEEMGEALKAGGVSLKRAMAGRLKWVGSVVHADLATGIDPASLSGEVARMVTAMGRIVAGVGKGAGALIVENLRGVASCTEGADILDSLVPADDPAAELLAKILALTTEFVAQNYVPSDLDAMVEVQRNVATMSGRA